MQQHVLEATDPRVLGRRLRAARKARHLTQQQVAESLELARTTITALEKGERRIRPNELIQLASLYGRSVSQLVGPREFREDFSVQFRAAVAGAETRQAQNELEQAIQSFQRLCEDYLYLERLNGAPIRRSYPSQYSISGVSPGNCGGGRGLVRAKPFGNWRWPDSKLEGDPRRRRWSSCLPHRSTFPCRGPVRLYG